MLSQLNNTINTKVSGGKLRETHSPHETDNERQETVIYIQERAQEQENRPLCPISQESLLKIH